MPTKLSRLNITFPDQALFETIKRDAEISRRSESSQIIWILEQYYSERKKEADLFTPTRLREAKQIHAPVFETPPLHPAEHVSKIRAILDQEKS